MECIPAPIRKSLYPLIACLGLGLSGLTYSETVQLYQNDFETPNVTPVKNCGHALDISPINTIYGQPGAQFSQINTVETVLINATGGSPNYSDPSGMGGGTSLLACLAFQAINCH